MTDKILLGLAGSNVGDLTSHFSIPLQNDPRFSLVVISTTSAALLENIRTGEPQVLIVYAELFPGPEEAARFLGSLKKALAIVILPTSWASIEGQFARIERVRKIFVTPFIPGEVQNAAYAIMQTEHALASVRGSAPTSLNAGASPGSAIAIGTRVMGIISEQGGVGRTTLAEALAYEMGVRRAIRTLLFSFDKRSCAPLHFKIRETPNAREFFVQPGRQGFDNASQSVGETLRILLAPQDEAGYLEAERRSVRSLSGDPGGSSEDVSKSIRNLVAMSYQQMVPVVLLDLPTGSGAWTYHALSACNTVLIVSRPTLDGLNTSAYLINVLTKMFGAEHQFQRESIFMVLNRYTAKSTYSPAQFASATADLAGGWCPPILATIPEDPAIPASMDAQRPPCDVSEALSRSTAAIADTFWPSRGSAEPVRKQKKFGPFRFTE
jgi:arsenite-transporting ATPase